MTVTPPGSFATAGSGTASVSASASAKTVVDLSIPLFSLTNDACLLRGRERYGAMAVLSSSDAPIARRRAGPPHPETGGGRQARNAESTAGFALVATLTTAAREAQDGTLIAQVLRELWRHRGWLSATLALASPPKVRRWTHEPPVNIAAE